MTSRKNHGKSSIETPNNQIPSVSHAEDNKLQTLSTLHGPKQKNDKQDNSKRNQDQSVVAPVDVDPSISTLNDRYALNVNNYVTELHAALLRECKDNLVSLNQVNAVSDSNPDITSQTLQAVKDEKIFSILGYFPKISEEMRKRGWVEKRNPNKPQLDYMRYLNSRPHVVNWVESPPDTTSKTPKQLKEERTKISQSWTHLKDKRSDFIFVTRKQLVHWTTLHKSTLISQFEKRSFCSKDGLIRCLEPYKNKVTNLMFPRCHCIRSEEEYLEFMEDFIITALIGTLKIIIKSIENNKRIFSERGVIPYEIIVFVNRCVLKFLNKQQTGSEEKDLWKVDSEKEVWDEFFGHYAKLISDDNVKIYHEYSYQLEKDVYARCKYLLDHVKNYCTQHYMDGNTNMWIMKPSANCSGHGIIMSRDIKAIRNKITVSDYSRNHFILQKYIEKPLLVYACKVDLRQWFLVTNVDPVVVWMYKEGYVRFCAENFSMRNMHESAHLSNVRLQMKYRKTRRNNVPEECMWDYQELKNHLTAIGQEHVWDDLIFPGMSESVHAVIQAAKDITLYRVNSFQLFGADFVITENFVPYLIEVNSIPGLNPSTSVIANLVPMLLGDLVKVVIDYAEDPTADTGLFVKVVPEDLTVTGVRESLAAAGKAKLEKYLFSPPNLSSVVTSKESYVKWMGDLNNRLDALRFRVNGQDKFNEHRYLGYYRDKLLAAVTSSDVREHGHVGSENDDAGSENAAVKDDDAGSENAAVKDDHVGSENATTQDDHAESENTKDSRPGSENAAAKDDRTGSANSKDSRAGSS